MDVQYKTQGWLEKFGWEAGKGLGRNLDGRSDIVHVSVKNDSQGLGVKNYEHLDFAHWDNLYTKAASKIHITSSDQGVVLKKVETVAPRASVYGGMFVKSTTDSVMSSDVKAEDLFSECGGSELRIFKQEGKMKRLKEAEERGGLCNVTDYFGALPSPSSSEKQTQERSNKRKREKSRSERKDKKSNKEKTKDSNKESKKKRDSKKDKEKKSKDGEENKKERSRKRKERETSRKDKSDKSDKKSKNRRKRQKTEHSA